MTASETQFVKPVHTGKALHTTGPETCVCLTCVCLTCVCLSLVLFQFGSACPLCNEWRREILRHHTKPSGVINWGNCRPWLWPAEHWELAKVGHSKLQACNVAVYIVRVKGNLLLLRSCYVV